MLSPAETDVARPIAVRFTLQGRVQGLGVRPAIARWAAACHVRGVVRNTLQGVEIEVVGASENVEQFRQQLPQQLPWQAKVASLTCQPVALTEPAGFVIEPSIAAPPSDAPLAVPVPRDIAVCPDCLADTQSGRRRDYAFTSCTSCGPRYSILEAMPYERAGTTMRGFVLCSACRHEYESPGDRRFHAQTNACPRCGPRAWLVDAAGRTLGTAAQAIAVAVEALRRGQIVALRGLGGYQLLVDALNEAAVERLRNRKHRPAKPLALLVASLAAAERLVTLSPADRTALVDPANPIVVVPCDAEGPISTAIHRGLNSVGLLLPTTPLHAQLAAQFAGPLVATSGNREGEPLAAGIHEAEQVLAGIADLWLHHDRPIHRPIDDSVVTVAGGRCVTLRLARGLAPLPLNGPFGESILAVGGQQTSALAVANGAQAALGPYLGDLENLAPHERFVHETARFAELYRLQPRAIAHDLHPGYFGTTWAESQPLPRVAVQHHHAHLAATMLESNLLDREVLGFAFDGTGYGPDGTIWGGECLRSTAASYRRVGHLRQFALPGGEAAVRQPWRVAAVLLADTLGAEAAVELLQPTIERRAVEATLMLAQRPRLAPRTSSMGRLFDAVAALVLGIQHAQYEGQPAMLLEAACDRSAAGSYPLPLVDGNPWQLDWRGLLAPLVADWRAAVPPGTIAMRFHRALADAVEQVAARYSQLPVVLGGGVFGNRVLLDELVTRLHHRPAGFFTPGLLPPGDGGLAAGQLLVAAARRAGKGTRSCA